MQNVVWTSRDETLRPRKMPVSSPEFISDALDNNLLVAYVLYVYVVPKRL